MSAMKLGSLLWLLATVLILLANYYHGFGGCKECPLPPSTHGDQ